MLYYDCIGDRHGIPELDWKLSGFDDSTIEIPKDNVRTISFDDLKREVRCNKKLDLSRDLILPCPWERSRLSVAITSIGKGRRHRAWRQDDNYRVELWLPIGIAWVRSGNHSITIGIIQGGEIKPECCYDISEIYKYIICDGEYYRRTKTNLIIKDEIIGPVTNVEIAAIFEIGRLLVENGLSFAN